MLKILLTKLHIVHINVLLIHSVTGSLYSRPFLPILYSQVIMFCHFKHIVQYYLVKRTFNEKELKPLLFSMQYFKLVYKIADRHFTVPCYNLQVLHNEH